MNSVTVQDILEAGKHASLTGGVLTEWAEKGTPNNANTSTGSCSPNTNHGSNHAASGC